MAFCNVKIGNLEYEASDSIRVPHCFTTRLGGVSDGYLASLNLGLNRGDREENVLKNYGILADTLGFSVESIVFTRQTHTNIVRVVDANNAGEGLFRKVEPECDALVTNTPGLALNVFTADCTPILLHDPVTGAVGAIHAGWRGTVKGIAANAVEAMTRCYGSDPADIVAAIGSNIGQCCFETDRDVPEALRECLGSDAEKFIRPQGEKYYVNLKGANKAILERAGVRTVEMSTSCTACAPDRFWSHRKVGQRRGSMAAIIVCQRGERE